MRVFRSSVLKLAQLIAACALLLVACDDGAPVGGPQPDAGERVDAAAAATDAGSPTASDAGVDDDAALPNGYPDPAYMGSCLTVESAIVICDHDGDAACGLVVGCGLSDTSECSIDCAMATSLCLDSAIVDACIAALEGRDCMSIDTACNGWMHF